MTKNGFRFLTGATLWAGPVLVYQVYDVCVAFFCGPCVLHHPSSVTPEQRFATHEERRYISSTGR